MGNRKTFNDFNQKPPSKDDFLIGYDKPEPGGEKKFKLSDLRNYVKTNDIVKIPKSGKLPILDPEDPAVIGGELIDEDLKPDIPFLSGKVFHITTQTHALIELPKLEKEQSVTCIVTNMTDHKRVELKTENKEPALNARGVQQYSSGLSDATTVTYLKKKFDTAIFYHEDGKWYGYGDLDGPSSLHIKNQTTDYVFSLEDEDRIIHFKHEAEGVKIHLPDPKKNGLKSGTQFFVHNISTNWIEFKVDTGVNFHARAKFLRRKYDDAVVYTDGVDWFATGDLS